MITLNIIVFFITFFTVYRVRHYNQILAAEKTKKGTPTNGVPSKFICMLIIKPTTGIEPVASTLPR